MFKVRDFQASVFQIREHFDNSKLIISGQVSKAFRVLCQFFFRQKSKYSGHGDIPMLKNLHLSAGFRPGKLTHSGRTSLI